MAEVNYSPVEKSLAPKRQATARIALPRIVERPAFDATKGIRQALFTGRP